MADDKLVPAVRTPVSMEAFARAAIAAWPRVGDGVPPKGALALLWAQFMIETGGTHVWNYNLGNVKDVPGDGIDFHALRGTWEGVSQAEADRLVAAGLATLDTNPNHVKAVAPRVAVVFQPPHPATRFSAFADLETGMGYHLELLAKRRYASAWPLVLLGDVTAFAAALRARGYFTASAEAYAAGMRPAYNQFIASGVYERFVGSSADIPNLTDEPFVEVELDGVKWSVCRVYVGPIGIGQAADLAAELGYELPSPELVDAIWRAADLRINGWTMAAAAGKHDGTPATMDSPEIHARVAAKIEQIVSAHGPFRLIAGAFKDVVRRGSAVGLYGWHDSAGAPIQRFFGGHSAAWRDYSQGLRLVRRA